jgi:hypothetical protein
LLALTSLRTQATRHNSIVLPGERLASCGSFTTKRVFDDRLARFGQVDASQFGSPSTRRTSAVLV